jgi:hypothetical protein
MYTAGAGYICFNILSGTPSPLPPTHIMIMDSRTHACSLSDEWNTSVSVGLVDYAHALLWPCSTNPTSSRASTEQCPRQSLPSL